MAGHNALGGRRLNEDGFCEHHCSDNRFPTTGQCGDSLEYVGANSVDCKGCNGKLFVKKQLLF